MPVSVRQRNAQPKNLPKKILSSQKSSKKGSFWRIQKKISESEILFTNAPTDLKGIYYPSKITAFSLLLVARLCAAIWSHITDCDETYNYWEPLHYLVYGNGLQTWEYSPAYAIRSYAALWVFAAPAKFVLDILEVQPFVIFYMLRVLLAICTSLAEVLLYKAICREFGVNVGRIWLAFTIPSAGSFISSAALLPSAWCGALTSAALASWWLGKLTPAVCFTAFSALVGWPFAALNGVPIALDTLRRQIPSKLLEFVIAAVLSFVAIMIPMVLIDSWYYGRLVVAPWNIVAYNLFTSHGPDLYGTEPYYFYLINGFLNFNVVWVLAVMCLAFLVISALVNTDAKPRMQFCQPYWMSLLPLYLWLMIFLKQPHKEERFLFPVYTMIPLCAAISVDCIQKVTFAFKSFLNKYIDKHAGKKKTNNANGGKKTHYLAHTNFVILVFVLVATLGSLSRIFALYKNYHSTMEILKPLNNYETDVDRVNVCFGADWYRSPSSFLLPDQRYRIRFIKSEFDGQMPAPYYEGPNATRMIHPYFNDNNKEDNSTYLQPSECHYLIHSDVTNVTTMQPPFHIQMDQWKIIDKRPFLNSVLSDRLFRAFYIPCLNERYAVYGNIYLLRNLKFEQNFKQKA